jgi:N-glycosylase/DNA lyase
MDRSMKPLLKIPVPNPFHLGYMVLSHGFGYLPPFQWKGEERCLHAVIRTHGDRAFGLKISCERNNRPGQALLVHKTAGPRVGRKDLDSLENRLRWCFRLDEDFKSFQKLCAHTPHLKWITQYGLGPLIRNSDSFEEFTKVLITTNISWTGTKLLNQNLLTHLGDLLGNKSTLRAFPTAERIAGKSEKYLRAKIRLGYRAPYLKALAATFRSHRVRPEELKDHETENLVQELGALKGFGPYAVHSLLYSFGRYDRLILDSWIRKMISRRYFKGRKVSDRALRRVYDRYGEWAGLVCWFESAYDTWFKDELHGQGARVLLNS